jgi:hypothetical protein
MHHVTAMTAPAPTHDDVAAAATTSASTLRQRMMERFLLLLLDLLLDSDAPFHSNMLSFYFQKSDYPLVVLFML